MLLLARLSFPQLLVVHVRGGVSLSRYATTDIQFILHVFECFAVVSVLMHVKAIEIARFLYGAQLTSAELLGPYPCENRSSRGGISLSVEEIREP